MKFTTNQYAQAFHESLQETSPKDQDKIIENFVEILKKNNDLRRYEEIIEAYEKLDQEARVTKEVQVTVARDTKLSQDILESLNKMLGKKAELKTKIDESIIGGIILRVDDTMIDASIKGQLEILKSNLTK